MRYEVLATDYDGTIADDGTVSPETITALEKLRASGRRVVLVTGREIEDLQTIFSRLDVCDVVVAENGALLFTPASHQFKCLHEPPPKRFRDELRLRGVAPISFGHVIVATSEPNEAVVLDVIKQLGLELEIIFNKGSVMILPSGVNKATGLAEALRQIGVTPEKTVGVGDAENDHALLKFCGCSAAVANALPSLKEHADVVLSEPGGKGVARLIERLIATDLSEITPRHWHPVR